MEPLIKQKLTTERITSALFLTAWAGLLCAALLLDVPSRILATSALLLGGVVLASIYFGLRKKIVEAQKKLSRTQQNETRQVEALLSLFATLEPSHPLPRFGGWAASPDFAKEVIDVILTERPSLIVEASSGVSTLIMAYCLKKVGVGQIISLEHSDEYAEQTRRWLENHGLTDFAAVYTAPLRKYELDGEPWQWYDLGAVDLPKQNIEMVVIDGPPRLTQRLARFPAFPILRDRLSPNSILMLDDGNRTDEQQIVRIWAKIESSLECKFLNLEKGAFICRRHNE